MEFSDWLGIVGLLTSFVTFFLGIWVGHRAHVPNLRLGGSGSYSNPVNSRDLVLTNIQVYNDPGFFRMRVNRESARIVSARLYDPELDEFVDQGLLWRADGSENLANRTTIESGTSQNLYLFAKDRYDNEFFTYHALGLKSEPSRPSSRYSEKKKQFGLFLADANGRHYRFSLVVRNSAQAVNVHSTTRWWTRLQRWGQ